jgi:hypothetical protein
MPATSEFLGELMRRKVIGAVVIYGAVAWLTIEMITVLVPLFGGADWLVRTGVVIVLLGLPVSVVAVSWWFDFNPRTLRLESSLDPEDLPENARLQRQEDPISAVPKHGLATSGALQRWRGSSPCFSSHTHRPLGTPAALTDRYGRPRRSPCSLS